MKYDGVLAEVRGLEAALVKASAVLDHAAAECERWAEQSRKDGWSTHQVDSNLQLAAKLRRAAALAREVIGERS